METRIKLLGHPVHPMLIPFPLGLLPTAVIFDILHLVTKNSQLAEASFWMIAAGVLGGLLAAVFGLADWLAIPGDTRAKRIGLLHGFSNVVVVVLFALSWWLRRPDPAAPPSASIILALVGLVLAGIAGCWAVSWWIASGWVWMTAHT